MAVTDPRRSIRYNGNGSSTVFATGFEFFDNTSVRVLVDKVVLVEGVDYTLTGGDGSSGSVVTTVAPPSGTGNVFIERTVPLSQSVDFVAGGAFDTDAADKVHDQLLYRIQELNEVNDRTLTIPAEHTAATWSGALPDPGDTTALPATGIHVLQMTAAGMAIVSVAATDFANPLTAKGQVVSHDGANPVALGPGIDGTILMALASEGSGNKFADISEALGYLLPDRGQIIRRGSGGVEAYSRDVAGKYLGSNGTDVVWLFPYNQGECQLVKDGVNLRLNRRRGSHIILKPNGNWIPIQVGSPGPTLGTGGLSPSTLYYIYAYRDGGLNVALEASTTGYVVDSSSGFEIKSGDETRLLVGMGQTNGSTAWQDDATNRLVRSWYHDEGVEAVALLASDTGTTSASFVEISGSLRLTFASWSGERFRASMATSVTASVASTVTIGFGVDSNAGKANGRVLSDVPSTGIVAMTTELTEVVASEGVHHIQYLMRNTAGTSTWQGNLTTTSVRLHGR